MCWLEEEASREVWPSESQELNERRREQSPCRGHWGCGADEAGVRAILDSFALISHHHAAPESKW